MTTEAILAIRNTAPKYLKGASDQTVRNRFWLAMLESEGRILYNQSGVACNWNVRARQPATRTHSSGVGVVYTHNQAFEQLTVPVAGLIGSQALDLKIQMMNKGPLAIVDLYADAMDSVLASVGNALSAQLFIRNTGNGDQLVGIDTPMVPDGSVVAADIVAAPSTTAAYGGKLVRPGSYGGTWSTSLPVKPSSVLGTDWPLGSGSSDYDFLAPKMINYTSTSWGTNGNTWADNCEHVLRRAKNWIRHLSGASKVPTLTMLAQELYDEFQDKLTTRERLMVSDYAGKLGFTEDVINYNGSLVKSEFDCPAGTGYAINIDEMSLFSLHDQLFYLVGPEFNNTALAHEVAIGFFGNLRMNPKHIAKFGAFA